MVERKRHGTDRSARAARTAGAVNEHLGTEWVVGAGAALERLALALAPACGVDLVDLYAERPAAIKHFDRRLATDECSPRRRSRTAWFSYT
jgi:hypothetical protein